MVLTQIPRVEHFFDGLTRWFGQEGGDYFGHDHHDRLGPSVLGHHQSIRLAEKRLFPLNYTPKRSQSLKKTDFVPVADFSSQEVSLSLRGEPGL